MTEQDQIKLMLQYISIGTKVLSSKIYLFVTLFLTFTLFAWAMYDPNTLRVAIATLFSLIVFLPVVRADGKLKEEKQIIEGS